MGHLTDLPVEILPLIFTYENFQHIPPNCSASRRNSSWLDIDRDLQLRSTMKSRLWAYSKSNISWALLVKHICRSFEVYAVDMITEAIGEHQKLYLAHRFIRPAGYKHAMLLHPLNIHYTNHLRGLGSYHNEKFHLGELGALQEVSLNSGHET